MKTKYNILKIFLVTSAYNFRGQKHIKKGGEEKNDDKIGPAKFDWRQLL